VYAQRRGSKRYPTAVAQLDTPYFRGRAEVRTLYENMETSVQDIIIGSIPEARGTDAIFT